MSRPIETMKKLPADRKVKKSQQTRERIVRTALTMMTRLGRENMAIRDICEEAGVSVGTFYKYFPSKNDIYFAIFESADDYFTHTVARTIKGESAAEQVIDFFRYYAKLNIKSGPDMVKKLYNPDKSWFARRRPMQQVLEAIIKNGQNSGEFTTEMKATEMVDFLFIFMRGCCYNWCMLNGSYDLEAQMVEYVKRVMPVLHAPESPLYR